MIQANVVFKNGVIYTMDPKVPEAQAVAVIGNVIAAVGSDDDMQTLIGPNTKVYDLGGKTMVPGFNENHNHMATWGLTQSGVAIDPERCPDLQTMKRVVAERIAQVKPGAWIYSRGYDETRLMDGQTPCAADLDEVSPGNPVLLTRTCGHISLANSLALKMAGIGDDTKDPQGGEIVRDENGKATGILNETAQVLVKRVMPPFDKNDIVKALELCSKRQLSLGITSSTDAGISHVVTEEVEGWVLAHALGNLGVRTYTMLYAKNWDRLTDAGITRGYGNAGHRFGSVKFLLDGGIGGATAALYEPYVDPPGATGIIYMGQDEMNETVMKYHDLGLQISCHAIGDRTIDLVLNAYEKAIGKNPRTDHRHRIEHFSMPTTEQIQRAKVLNVCLCMNPGFFYYLGDSHLRAIGGDRVSQEFPMKSALNAGINVSFGSDSPVINGDPAYGLYGSVFRKTATGKSCGPAEALSMKQALWCYTQAGAYATFEENIKGSITPGKLADFAVLSLDPTKIGFDEAEKLLEMKNVATILDGQVVYGNPD